MESDLVLQSQNLANKPALEANQIYNKAAASDVWEVTMPHIYNFFFHRKKMSEKETEGEEQHFEILSKFLPLPHKSSPFGDIWCDQKEWMFFKLRES